jgi:hypothetical protein
MRRHTCTFLRGTQVCPVPTKKIWSIDLPINKMWVCVPHFVVLLAELGTHEIMPREKIVLQNCRNIREYKTNGLEAACRY